MIAVGNDFVFGGDQYGVSGSTTIFDSAIWANRVPEPNTVWLLVGGLAAAPLGGYAAKKIPARPLLIMVSVVLVVTSAWGIWNALR